MRIAGASIRKTYSLIVEVSLFRLTPKQFIVFPYISGEILLYPDCIGRKHSFLPMAIIGTAAILQVTGKAAVRATSCSRFSKSLSAKFASV